MEKFTNWRDKATGISPFMPIPDPNPSSIISHLSKLIILIVKLPIIFLAYVLNYITLLVPALNDVVTDLLFVKLLFNVGKPEIVVDGVKKSNIAATKSFSPKKGDVCVANFSSPLDAYMLRSISQNRATAFVTVNDSGNLFLLNGGPDAVFRYALTGGTLVNSLSISQLQDLKSLKNKAVFVFIEGTTSNNRAILTVSKDLPRFSELIDSRKQSLKAISLSASPTHLITTPLPISSFTYCYRLIVSGLFSLSNRFKIRIFNVDSTVTNMELREKLSNYGKMKLTGSELSVSSKHELMSAMRKAGKLI